MVRQIGGDRIAYEEVNATRGKEVRASPVALIYEQGRVHHIGVFDLLEDQLCGWTPDSGWSPDRLDAAIWSLAKLSERAVAAGSAFRERQVRLLPA
jgi:phage terminase large subunit-like protein